MQGISTRVTSGNIGVLRCHYSADSSKRPGTPKGDVWIAQEAAGYPLGMDDPRWHKEMEIKPSAMGGQALFSRWPIWSKNPLLVVDPYHAQNITLYGSYDHGVRHPACFLVHGVDGDGVITTLWEFYEADFSASQIANIIKGHPGYSESGKRHDGCPYDLNDLAYIVADPSMWNEDKPQDKGPNKSTAKIFRDLGISMIPGERGGDLTLANWLTGHYWKDQGNPLYRICANCPKLIWSIGQQRFKQLSDMVAINKSQPEELVDKDNDGWDSLKYFLKRFPPAHALAKPEQKANTFAWHRSQEQRRLKGLPTRTFRIEVR